MGRKQFDAKYGNFGHCVSGRAHEKSHGGEGSADESSEGEGKGREAVEACRAEGKQGREFGQCVSGRVSAP